MAKNEANNNDSYITRRIGSTAYMVKVVSAIRNRKRWRINFYGLFAMKQLQTLELVIQ